jgi:hypothetical protein
VDVFRLQIDGAAHVYRRVDGGAGPCRDGARGSPGRRERWRRKASPGRREGEIRRPASPEGCRREVSREMQLARAAREPAAQGLALEVRSRASPDPRSITSWGRKKPCGRREPARGRKPGGAGVLRSAQESGRVREIGY